MAADEKSAWLNLYNVGRKCTMKYGFLFGAGAEAAYGLPSGGKFALEIFRQNTPGSDPIKKK